jgi:adhesin transport system outer membrane protein
MSHPPCRALVLRACALAVAALVAGGAAARCVDEDEPPTPSEGGVEQGVPAQPMATLQTLVRDALERSSSVGAAKLSAEAALHDIDETRATKGVQASIGGGLGPGGSQSLAGTETSALQVRASVSIGQLLYDGGRVDRLADWRTQLAESARYGHLTVREQLALNTVSLALERSRYRQHVIIYGQYVRKMSCLVQALETIVRADRGRASELVLASKSMQQAELALAQAQTQARQTEIRLRRLVGDGLPSAEGLSTVLLGVPELNQLMTEVERNSEISALAAQAAAMGQYARALSAGTSPQVSWSLNGSQNVNVGGSRGNSRSGTYAIGLAVNIPLLNPGVEPAMSAAQKRARAAELQREEALQARRYRLAEVYEQTVSSFDRARRMGAVLRDSDQVRNFTLQQWQQLGRRSLFDVMGAEGEHYNLRVNYVNALHDGQQLNANLLSLGRGVLEWLQ